VSVPALVTTLNARLEAAVALHELGRFGAALAAFEDLIGRAQERRDRPVEVVGRSMAARCLLRRRDVDGAREHLQAAGELVDPVNVDAHAAYRGALARLAVAESQLEELRNYLDWAERHAHAASVVDACRLLARHSEGEDQAVWLERGEQEADAAGLQADLGSLCTELGAALDQLGRADEALAAYERALGHHRRSGSPRQLVGACWAAGATAIQLEDWPLARQHLEEAVQLGGEVEEAFDLLALALGDLARVHEAAGDVVEARHLVLRSVKIARDQDLPSLWPTRWQSLVQLGRSLELDV
jgi:tetratricopeptide (TPR) repeat protein